MLETALHPWAPGPLQPRLGEGAVHVWRANLDEVADDMSELLDSEERERAERMLHEHTRRRWSRSRGLLRVLLGGYLQREPRSLGFAVGLHGKPELADDPGHRAAHAERARPRSPRISFNLSHSDDLALYAFSESAAVGVDVELARSSRDEVAIARRVLGSEEAARLEALDPDARARAFRRAWVRYEAELKCSGDGVGRGMESGRPRGLWTVELDVGPNAAGAVSSERAARELCCWEWRG